MATAETKAGDIRERLLGAAELACAAWVVIGHNVLKIFPAEAPVLAVIAIVAARLMRGGFCENGAWRLAVGLSGLVLAAAYLLSDGDLWSSGAAHRLIDTTAVVLGCVGLES